MSPRTSIGEGGLSQPYHPGLKVKTFADEAAAREKSRAVLSKMIDQHGVRGVLLMLARVCQDRDAKATRQRHYGLAHLFYCARVEITEIISKGNWPS